MAMTNEEFGVGEVCDYKEGGEIFRVKILEREVRPFSPADSRVFLFLALEKLDDHFKFTACHSLDTKDQGAEYLCWRLFPKGTYLSDE
jgi:hypothetical protein